jgi:hypothetical protein
MPERFDVVPIVILTKRPLCEACHADRVGFTGEGARAALDHLNDMFASTTGTTAATRADTSATRCPSNGGRRT